jgi:hypothetical protein
LLSPSLTKFISHDFTKEQDLKNLVNIQAKSGGPSSKQNLIPSQKILPQQPVSVNALKQQRQSIRGQIMKSIEERREEEDES